MKPLNLMDKLFNKSDLTEGKKVKQVPVIRRKD